MSGQPDEQGGLGGAASALDRGALSCADLAYIEAGGPPADRVAMAIRAYLWALANTEPHPLGTAYPSLNQWREEAARIAREGGPLLAPGVSTDSLLGAPTPSAPTGDHGGLRGAALEAIVPESAHEWARGHYIAFTDFSDPDPDKHVPFGTRKATWRDAPTTWGEVVDTLAAHPEPEPAQVGEVAAVLAEHERFGPACDCGWISDDPRASLRDDHRAHLAAALVAAGVRAPAEHTHLTGPLQPPKPGCPACPREEGS